VILFFVEAVIALVLELQMISEIEASTQSRVVAFLVTPWEIADVFKSLSLKVLNEEF
jgi:hypothetical protein